MNGEQLNGEQLNEDQMSNIKTTKEGKNYSITKIKLNGKFISYTFNGFNMIGTQFFP
jgi:hypothetical protein